MIFEKLTDNEYKILYNYMIYSVPGPAFEIPLEFRALYDPCAKRIQDIINKCIENDRKN